MKTFLFVSIGLQVREVFFQNVVALPFWKRDSNFSKSFYVYQTVTYTSETDKSLMLYVKMRKKRVSDKSWGLSDKVFT